MCEWPPGNQIGVKIAISFKSLSETKIHAKLLRFSIIIFRSSCQEELCKKDVLKKFAKFTGKHLRPATLLKKRLFLIKGVFLWFAKFLRTPFLAETSGGYFCIFQQQSKHRNYYAVFLNFQHYTNWINVILSEHYLLSESAFSTIL